MIRKSFYLDTCIWLNLFKKEDANKGLPFWRIAKMFIEKVTFSDCDEIIFTGFVLKELKFIINNDKIFQEQLKFLKGEERFRFIKSLPEDYEKARNLESALGYEVSFFDCIHIAICIRNNLTLITRDELLIKFAREYIHVFRPEDLLS